MVGLKDKPKCGRTPHLTSEIVHKIRKKLTESVNDMIVEESGIQYHYTHVYRLLHKTNTEVLEVSDLISTWQLF